MSSRYDDIINTQWPQPSLREKMPLKDRAKIFMPFAALKGFEELIEKTAKEHEETSKKSYGSETDAQVPD
ncbi:hypothetical protein [Treponema sp.]|uniref:hypothetical protein n=1 Tax=Treponema sp. TaxID=166 RepID=UPI0025EB9351|nr:hypothetical protein [Treponema sp.]MCR5217904.1 hypothetical protein [Treponema sp.]